MESGHVSHGQLRQHLVELIIVGAGQAICPSMLGLHQPRFPLGERGQARASNHLSVINVS